MTTTTLRFQTAGRVVPARSGLKRALSTLQLWHARARQRRQLAGLDYPELKDLGISRADALQEAEKPFWQD